MCGCNEIETTCGQNLNIEFFLHLIIIGIMMKDDTKVAGRGGRRREENGEERR